MALIKCSECGKKISDKASVCIHCGCPIEAQPAPESVQADVKVEQKKDKPKGKGVILGLSIGSFLIVLVFFLLLLLKTPEIITKDLMNPYEAVVMIAALNEDTQKDILFEKYKKQYEGDTQEETVNKEMTYDELTEMLEILDLAGNLSAKMLDNVPKDKYVERK